MLDNNVLASSRFEDIINEIVDRYNIAIDYSKVHSVGNFSHLPKVINNWIELISIVENTTTNRILRLKQIKTQKNL